MTARLHHLDRVAWGRAAATFSDYSYRQLWDFGTACAERVGACSEHTAVCDADGLLGLADVRVRRLPLLGSGIAYVNGGPLVRRSGEGDPQRLRSCLLALQHEYVERRGLLLRVQPALGSPEWNAAQEQVFRNLGFAAGTAAPYRTLLVPIEPPLEQIRKRLEQKWRNGLNRAERNGLHVCSGTESSLFGQFGDLYGQLLERKQFGVDLHADFYAAVQGRLDPPERFLVSLVEVDGAAVAGHVASILGDTAVYLLGASSKAALQNKASYLLQWHTILAAKARGCHWYDLGGIDPEGNPGVYHFKQGLGGIDVTAPGPFERAPAGVRHHIVRGCERMYRSVRNLARHGAGRTKESAT